MDITQIDAASFATRTAQVATAELYSLLSSENDFSPPKPNWFNASLPADSKDPREHVDRQVALDGLIERLGGYVCSHQVDQGERLYRWGVMEGIVPRADWSAQPFELRQAFETFADTCRNTFMAISVAQLAIEEARTAAGIVPVGLKREDSIFADDGDTLGTLRPEAIAAGPLIGRYTRERAAEEARIREQKRIDDAAAAVAAEADRQKFNGADPEAFDHDGDKKPGGSRKGPRRAKPAPKTVGEAPVRPPVNRGGRGRRKPPATS